MLRCFVEGKAEAIAQKAMIIVEHFHSQTAAKIRGLARAMVVTGSIQRALTYLIGNKQAVIAPRDIVVDTRPSVGFAIFHILKRTPGLQKEDEIYQISRVLYHHFYHSANV